MTNSLDNPSARVPAQSADPVPHQLANELTRDRGVVSNSTLPDTERPQATSTGTLPSRVERRVGHTLLLIVRAALVIGLLVSASLMQRFMPVVVGAIFVVPFLLLVSAPAWLASVTKQSQDETVREQREPPDA